MLRRSVSATTKLATRSMSSGGSSFINTEKLQQAAEELRRQSEAHLKAGKPALAYVTAQGAFKAAQETYKVDSPLGAAGGSGPDQVGHLLPFQQTLQAARNAAKTAGVVPLSP